MSFNPKIQRLERIFSYPQGTGQFDARLDRLEKRFRVQPEDAQYERRIERLNAIIDEEFSPHSYSGDIVSFETVFKHKLSEAKVVLEPIQSGSGDPSPTNVRPITGHTGATLNRTGKNLAEMTYGNQVPSISTGQMVSSNGWCSPFIPVDNTKAYMVSAQMSQNEPHYIFFYDAEKNYLGVETNWNVTNGYNLRTSVNWSQTKFIKLRADNDAYNDPKFQLEVGSTTTGYEPFGASYTSSFGQTVYGGTFDFVSGKLVVKWGLKDLGSMTWVASSTPHCFYSSNFADGEQYAMKQTGIGFKCTAYKYDGERVTPPYFGENGTFCAFGRIYPTSPCEVYFHDDNYDTAADFKAGVTGQYICYELSTPIEIDLDPTEVETLIGTNNVWSDAGAVTIKIN